MYALAAGEDALRSPQDFRSAMQWNEAEKNRRCTERANEDVCKAVEVGEGAARGRE